MIVVKDNTSLKKLQEKENILKRLVSSQETYIKELETKNTELKDFYEQEMKQLEEQQEQLE